MFRRFLESYIAVCDNIVTESANSVLMFEAGEQAAMDIKISNLQDLNKEFETTGISVNVEISGKKVIYHVKGLTFKGKKCTFCDILRGFFGGMARKHLDSRYYCRKGAECIIEGKEECTFEAELIE